MFEKLRDLKKAQEMQRAFAQEKHTLQQKGVRVTVNGSLQVEEIVVEADLSREEVGPVVAEVVNEAFRGIQQKIARQILS